VEAVSYADLCFLVVDYCLDRVSSPLFPGIETGRYLGPASGEKGGVFGLLVASGLYPVSVELQGIAARDFAQRLPDVVPVLIGCTGTGIGIGISLMFKTVLVPYSIPVLINIFISCLVTASRD